MVNDSPFFTCGMKFVDVDEDDEVGKFIP